MKNKCPKCKKGKLKTIKNKTNLVYKCTNCDFKSYKIEKNKNINFIGKFLNNCYL